jgi:hypothetical protein
VQAGEWNECSQLTYNINAINNRATAAMAINATVVTEIAYTPVAGRPCRTGPLTSPPQSA